MANFKSNYNLVEELKWRGLMHDMIPKTDELLESEMVTAYCGFDPTADALHIGNLVPIILLMHIQRSGHKPIALVGGATGRVGDPSGKTSERQLLDIESINYNLNAQKKQLEQFLDFNANENSAEVVNNYDWFKDLNFLDFIRDVGKHISVNYMMSKDSVKNRLETGMSFTEFSYQLVQGYDFYHLYKTKNCKLQIGGSDQWGNIVTGTELIRRKGNGSGYAITAPLITKADGSKFGKSEGGNVWLDANRTSPYSFYQFWLNISDEDASKYIKIFTFLKENEINDIIVEHYETPHQRLLQKTLAKEVTCMVHSEKDWEDAIKTSEIFFGKNNKEDLLKLGEKLFKAVTEGLPNFKIDASRINKNMNILDLLATDSSILPSKNEAKKMLKSNAISLNKSKITDENYELSSDDLLFDKYLLIQRGKKNYFAVNFI